MGQINWKRNCLRVERLQFAVLGRGGGTFIAGLFKVLLLVCQSSIRPSIYFSLIAKSLMYLFLEPTCAKQ